MTYIITVITKEMCKPPPSGRERKREIEREIERERERERERETI